MDRLPFWSLEAAMKRIDIEALLKWAFCEELPKEAKVNGHRSGSRMVSPSAALVEHAALGVRVDTSGPVPAKQSIWYDAAVHPDAFVVRDAVNSLDDLTLEIPEGWNPMPELDDLGAHGAMALRAAIDRLTVIDQSGQRTLRTLPSVLVRNHAVLDTCPGEGASTGEVPVLIAKRGPDGGHLWFREVVEKRKGLNGAPINHRFEKPDGWCRVRKAPKRGAYQKLYLDPDPVPVLVARGEYELWRACLVALVEILSESLVGYDITGPIRPAVPWDDDAHPNDPRQPVVLRDLRRHA
jgi:hypothetical protein